MSAPVTHHSSLLSVLTCVDRVFARFRRTVKTLPPDSERGTAWEDALAGGGLSEVWQEWNSACRWCQSFSLVADTHWRTRAPTHHMPAVAALIVKAVDILVGSIPYLLPSREEKDAIKETASRSHKLLGEIIDMGQFQQEAHGRVFDAKPGDACTMIDCVRFVWIAALLARIKHGRTEAGWFDQLPYMVQYLGMPGPAAAVYTYEATLSATRATEGIRSDAIELGWLWHEAEQADDISSHQESMIERSSRMLFKGILAYVATTSLAAVGAAQSLCELSLAVAKCAGALAYAAHQTPLRAKGLTQEHVRDADRLARGWNGMHSLARLLDELAGADSAISVAGIRTSAHVMMTPTANLILMIDFSELEYRGPSRSGRGRGPSRRSTSGAAPAMLV